MKRNAANLVSVIALEAMCLMSACSGYELDETVVEEMTEGSHWQRADVNFHVSRINFDAQAGATRSVDEGWKDGDRIYLILKDKNGGNVQAHVTYDASIASWGQIEYDGYKDYLTCTTPRAVEAYFFDGTVNVTDSRVAFDATTGIYACTDGEYTYPSNGDLEVNVSLAPLTSRIRFTGESGTSFSLGGITTYTAFSRTTGQLTETTSDVSTSVQSSGYTPYIYGVFSSSTEPSFIVKIDGVVLKTIFDSSTKVFQVGHSGYMAVPTADSHRGWKKIVAPTGISINKSSLSMKMNETVSLQATITPSDATSTEVVWSSSKTSVATVSAAGVVKAVGSGTATITASVKDFPDIKATCLVTVVNANGHAYVDLGLTSGTLWATMNVGATSPEDYGDYFAWGEVTGYDKGKTSFSWSTYKYCNGSSSSMTKYCTSSSYGTVDNKTELELSDDAARHNWEGSWRMPSKEQFKELYDECTWTWTTQSGVSGYRVSSKKNANSLFLPAAGFRDTSLYYAGSYGYYWSRSLGSGNSSYAYGLYFNSSYVSPSYSNIRYYGRSVRPVLGSE
ncbi:MAG: Ig-like domain-containing protein [Bacteroidaceae bacterium]|nr:Ig-like domain-containing protein [Bacteroidaceae bacterium]